MKKLTMHEILKKSLEMYLGSKSYSPGLCSITSDAISHLCSKNSISIIEQIYYCCEIETYLEENVKTTRKKLSIDGYYWKKNRRRPRIRWMKKHIKITKRKNL